MAVIFNQLGFNLVGSLTHLANDKGCVSRCFQVQDSQFTIISISEISGGSDRQKGKIIIVTDSLLWLGKDVVFRVFSKELLLLVLDSGQQKYFLTAHKFVIMNLRRVLLKAIHFD